MNCVFCDKELEPGARYRSVPEPWLTERQDLVRRLHTGHLLSHRYRRKGQWDIQYRRAK